MSGSFDRILTTHTGSLIRPPEVRELLDAIEQGAPPDDRTQARILAGAVARVVRQQAEAGLDIVNDGELGKISWIAYLYDRISGIEARKLPPGTPVWPPSRDRQAFPEFYADEDRRYAEQANRAAGRGGSGRRAGRFGLEQWVCVEPIRYTGLSTLERDIANLKQALAGAPVAGGFLTAVAPASVYWLRNEYYKSEEAFVFALADALRTEYRTIVDAGLFLQVDDAVLAHEYDSVLARGGSVEDYRRWAALRLEALKHALEGVPAERVRYHICFGSWHGPHAYDPPLGDIIDLVLQVPARYYLIEQANPRHEHEWRLWERVKLPDDKVLVPGVVTHHTNVVEHPELVAERLTRLARLVGRERVMGGTDCGFAQRARVERVHPSIQWAKLRSLAEGARIARRALWSAPLSRQAAKLEREAR